MAKRAIDTQRELVTDILVNESSANLDRDLLEGSQTLGNTLGELTNQRTRKAFPILCFLLN